MRDLHFPLCFNEKWSTLTLQANYSANQTSQITSPHFMSAHHIYAHLILYVNAFYIEIKF